MLLDTGPQVEPSSHEEASRIRAELHALLEQLQPQLIDSGPEMAWVADETIPVEGGEITVRIYRPSDTARIPVCLYIHGGGWWQGNLTLVDPECRYLAQGAGCVVVSVAYRLAPEHPFPIPLEDCYAALCWVAENADRLDIDPDRIAVTGGSAGGNLSAALALLTRDRGGPRLIAQVLVVPATDLSWSQPSIDALDESHGLTKSHLQYCVSAYVGEHGDPRNPLISPLYADLHDLPPALIITAEYDPLRDDGEAYGHRLQEAGVPAIVHCLPGMMHGTFVFTKLVPEVAEAYFREMGDFLAAAFQPRPVHPAAGE
jgi:acetyl esterase